MKNLHWQDIMYLASYLVVIAIVWITTSCYIDAGALQNEAKEAEIQNLNDGFVFLLLLITIGTGFVGYALSRNILARSGYEARKKLTKPLLLGIFMAMLIAIFLIRTFIKSDTTATIAIVNVALFGGVCFVGTLTGLTINQFIVRDPEYRTRTQH